MNFIWNEGLKCYCEEKNPTIRADKDGNVFGGGSPKISSPQPPQQPSTKESIDAWVESMPRIFAEQQRQAPLEAQQQVELAQQYAGPLAEAFKTAQEAMYPTETALSKSLGQQAESGMKEGLPQWMRDQYQSDIRANLGTNAGSGMGAEYTSRGLLSFENEYQNYYRNLAMSLTGRQPVATAQMPSYSNYASTFTPGSVMNYKASTYSPYASAYASMYGTNAQYLPTSPLQNLSQQMGYANSFMGGVGQMGSSIAGMLGMI